MKNIVLAFTAVALLLVLSTTASLARQLTNTELHRLFAGNTINLSAPFGQLPISYSEQGTMIAQSTVMLFFSGIYEDKGTWRIREDQVCQRWQTWNSGREQCFIVKRKGDTLHWKSNDGMTGTANQALQIGPTDLSKTSN